MTPPRLALALLLLWPGLSCGAPRSVALEGEAAEAIRRGIASGTGTLDHRRFDRVLLLHARETGARFDYAGLKASPGDLDAYREELAKVDLAGLGRDEILALLLNAYNAFTIGSILETMTPERPEGVGSIREIPQVFARKTHLLGGFRLSLDNIEHNLIRPLFRDPRIHFAVNCAAASCPPLVEEAFTGAKLERLLENATRRVLSSPDFARVEAGRLRLTRILDWYGTDFVTEGFRGAEPSLPRYVAKYASGEVRDFIEEAGGNPPVEFLEYDWTLNRAVTPRIQTPTPE